MCEPFHEMGDGETRRPRVNGPVPQVRGLWQQAPCLTVPHFNSPLKWPSTQGSQCLKWGAGALWPDLPDLQHGDPLPQGSWFRVWPFCYEGRTRGLIRAKPSSELNVFLELWTCPLLLCKKINSGWPCLALTSRTPECHSSCGALRLKVWSEQSKLHSWLLTLQKYLPHCTLLCTEDFGNSHFCRKVKANTIEKKNNTQNTRQLQKFCKN